MRSFIGNHMRKSGNYNLLIIQLITFTMNLQNQQGTDLQSALIQLHPLIDSNPCLYDLAIASKLHVGALTPLSRML